MVCFGDQIAGASLLSHLLQAAKVLAQLLASGLRRPARHLRQLFELAAAQARLLVGRGAGWVHSSSRGRALRTLPRPKCRPNCSS